ncbi:flagellar hook protein FlgE [Actibacterium sp. 188UL27-1]|uniref:flagellar hook protein FlgE n=1 Tax=Actibacterium sp. 188UL27-1 TaxID=2786961 RepID=UPI00195CFD06|nr:flagellar hook-basal body complex protein [Actibacterium sp. 188UL27-1]MBM7069860.1 flagellar hook-basal body complex protein [Actibacterium sp. 188UL27-1]
MTISSSLNAGVSGLNANASRLASISDNIANSATYGYKRVRTDFASMVTSSGTGAYSAGGVRVSSQRLIDQTSSLLTTSNATDLAVRGRGFLPVTTESSISTDGAGSTPMFLTTTGSFRTDAEGLLKSQNGLVLLGWPANPDGTIPDNPRDTADALEPIQINVNQFVAEPTTKMTLGVNLPAVDTRHDPTGQAIVRTTPVEYFDNLGTSRQVIVTYTPDVTVVGDQSNQWTMTLQDSAQIDPGTGQPLVIGEYFLEFDESTQFAGTLRTVTQDPVNPIGGAYDPLLGTFSVDVDRGPIEVTIGGIGAGGGITQFADSFAPTSIFKDGAPIANMVSVEVDANGYVTANFDTGINRTIYQIPLVDLPNPNGLVAMDNQTYRISNESGSVFLWDAGDGPTGEIIGFALEESSTDVAGELTSLIQTQRAYTSNAKVIQTVDEMLQETTNIKR